MFDDTKPVNVTMTKVEFLFTTFLTTSQMVLGMVTVENINILTACLGFSFLVLRNLPFLFVRIWEIGLFLFYKRERKRMVEFWRRELKKRLPKTKTDKEPET